MELTRSNKTAHKGYHSNTDCQQRSETHEALETTLADSCQLQAIKANALCRKQTDKRRSTTTQAIEKGNGLRHLYHLHSLRHDTTYQHPDDNGWPNCPNRQNFVKNKRDSNTCQHSHSRKEIARNSCLYPRHHGDALQHNQSKYTTDDYLIDIHRSQCRFFLNIISMRWVTPKPPNTLTAAKTMARHPATCDSHPQ